jgi:iron complex transport system substrate-binding protein
MKPPSSLALATPRGGRPPTARQSRFHGGKLGRVIATAWLLLHVTAHAAIDIVDDRGRHVALPTAPQRVVSLLPSLTESICALGACKRLVGVDRYSNWPAAVKELPQLGGLEDTTIERLVALKPDLVFVARSARALDRLEALGLRVVALEPKNLADTERVIKTVALALGEAPAGAALWKQLDARISAAAARVPAGQRGRKVYFEVGAAPYAAGEASFIGEVLARLGMGNAVPASLGPFPKLNPEFVVRANPDVVMASARAVEEMAGRPGWGAMKALNTRQRCGFVPERWEVLLRPGPRLADAAEALADCLAGLPQP